MSTHIIHKRRPINKIAPPLFSQYLPNNPRITIVSDSGFFYDSYNTRYPTIAQHGAQPNYDILINNIRIFK